MNKRERLKEWRGKNPKKVRKHNRDNYQRHKKKILAVNAAWQREHREEVRAYKRRWHRERYVALRREVLGALGGQCKRCGIEDVRVLCIDHIDGGGYRELKSMRGITYYKHVLENLKKYQLLCHNCNWIKRWENNEVRK